MGLVGCGPHVATPAGEGSGGPVETSGPGAPPPPASSSSGSEGTSNEIPPGSISGGSSAGSTGGPEHTCGNGVAGEVEVCYAEAQYFSLPGATRSIDVADFDADGHVDLVAGTWNAEAHASPKVAIMFGDGVGSFSEARVVPVHALGRTALVVAADVGVATGHEILVAKAGPVDLATVVSTGPRDFSLWAELDLPYAAAALLRADVDADGLDDALVSTAAQLRVARSDGQGGLEPALELGPASAGGYIDVHTADFWPGEPTGIVVLEQVDGASSIEVWRITESLGHEVVEHIDSQDVRWIRTGDLDGDQDPDLVLAGSHGVGASRNLGDGTFASLDFVELDVQPTMLVSGDVNGDGRDDAIVAASSPGRTEVVHFMLSTADGLNLYGESLTTQADVEMHVGDFNEDGVDDLVTVANVGEVNEGIALLLSDP